MPRTLEVAGFKSVREAASIEIRPLTFLCGTNSSGKSAFMQPLLLIKQTLEVGYDPGPLLLDGPNVSFGKASEMFWHGKAKRDVAKQFSIAYRDVDGESMSLAFARGSRGVDLKQVDYTPPKDEATGTRPFTLRASMTHEELLPLVDDRYRELFLEETGMALEVQRQRCFYEIRLRYRGGTLGLPSPTGTSSLMQNVATTLLHLPGLRDLPERLYPATRSGEVFPGPFHPYVASVIATWADQRDHALTELNTDLQAIGLTWKVESKRIDDTKVAIRVGRLPKPQQGGASDMVNIADVGLGVSQTLPILVALRVARQGQLVYLEQPEIHLHPRAQVALSGILLDAAARGVLVVCETHSNLLIRAVQREVARRERAEHLVKMHWFSRDDAGATSVVSGELSADGSFGDWPMDFFAVELELDNEYLDILQAAW
jgi:hypothetical protein